MDSCGILVRNCLIFLHFSVHSGNFKIASTFPPIFPVFVSLSCLVIGFSVHFFTQSFILPSNCFCFPLIAVCACKYSPLRPFLPCTCDAFFLLLLRLDFIDVYQISTNFFCVSTLNIWLFFVLLFFLKNPLDVLFFPFTNAVCYC